MMVADETKLSPTVCAAGPQLGHETLRRFRGLIAPPVRHELPCVGLADAAGPRFRIQSACDVFMPVHQNKPT